MVISRITDTYTTTRTTTTTYGCGYTTTSTTTTTTTDTTNYDCPCEYAMWSITSSSWTAIVETLEMVALNDTCK